MSSSILISVILAVTNGQKFLKETIDSLLNQTYKTIEIIVVVNCSQDATLEILQDYDDERIRIYETNICQLNFNLNYGLSKAKGEYIVRIDADDIAIPERFFKQMIYMQKYDVVGSNIIYIDEYSNIIGRKNYPEHNEEIRKKIYYTSVLAHPSVMIKKAILLKNSGYMGGKVSEDYDLWLRLIRDSSIKFYNIQENLILYRIHPKQARGNKYAYAEIAGYFLREALYFRSFKSFIGCLVYVFKMLHR